MKYYVLEYRATVLVVGKRPKRSKIRLHVPAHRLEEEGGGEIVAWYEAPGQAVDCSPEESRREAA